MRELTSQPQPASPYTPIGGSNMPTAPGLSTPDNTLQSAQMTQEQGRGQDSMLVHMTPDEVNSLRGLAQRFGGDL